jgi:hypothetical protein
MENILLFGFIIIIWSWIFFKLGYSDGIDYEHRRVFYKQIDRLQNKRNML